MSERVRWFMKEVREDGCTYYRLQRVVRRTWDGQPRCFALWLKLSPMELELARDFAAQKLLMARHQFRREVEDHRRMFA